MANMTATAAGNTATDKPDIMMIDDVRPGHEDNIEKSTQIRVMDTFHVIGLSDDDANFYNNYTPEQRARTKRKVGAVFGVWTRSCWGFADMIFAQIDIRLTPMLALLYLISHLDRSNIGNTKIEGIDDDLGISGIQWNIVLSLFFVVRLSAVEPGPPQLQNETSICSHALYSAIHRAGGALQRHPEEVHATFHLPRDIGYNLGRHHDSPRCGSELWRSFGCAPATWCIRVGEPDD